MSYLSRQFDFTNFELSISSTRYYQVFINPATNYICNIKEVPVIEMHTCMHPFHTHIHIYTYMIISTSIIFSKKLSIPYILGLCDNTVLPVYCHIFIKISFSNFFSVPVYWQICSSSVLFRSGLKFIVHNG